MTVPEDLNPLAEPRDSRTAPRSVLVVFGASGDLTTRKLMPAVAQLARRGLLPAGFSVVGVARTPMTDDEFRGRMTEAIGDLPDGFAFDLHYVSGDYAAPTTFQSLQQVLADLDQKAEGPLNRLFYLATPSDTFPVVVRGLAGQDLARSPHPDGQVRIVIEKPYGHDGPSAAALDAVVHEAFDENQVYRIDHYLGKETVQNVLALRFANAILEPIWNRRYINHVQITVAESLGVGHRGPFYEQAGALRDIVQNHVLQVLALTLMEPPATFQANAIRDEKVKVLRAVDVLAPEEVGDNVVRAQYRPGWVEGESVGGYRDEVGVDPYSQTETYVAMRLRVDNWRWAGVPIYIRTGKYLPKRVTEVALEFNPVPHLPFAAGQVEKLEADALVLRIQPDEGVTLRFGAKVPGQAFTVRSVSMDFLYGAAFLEETIEAYERLLLDALVGDPTLFIRSDEVAQAWRIVDPVLAAFAQAAVPMARYEAGTWGPPEADELARRDDRSWRKP